MSKKAGAGVVLSDELVRERGRLERAEGVVGHAFADRALLLTALTHTSYLNEHATAVGSNEQLELIGDAALSLVTVDALLKQTPHSAEGALTERRAAYVSEAALARAADRLALASLLRTGRAFNNPTVSARADLVEAIVGAVYRDAGLEAARRAVHALLGPPPDRTQADDAASAPAAHAKRVLQERLQGVFGEPPRYDVERIDGPNHAPVFRARCVFRGESIGVGEGRTKQAATEEAAGAALAALAPHASDEALRARFPGSA